jgi:membrane protein implicated in regulation of membrane protease activity
MNRGNWIFHLILGIIIAGAFLVGIAVASFVILPIIAILIAAVLIYYWLNNRRRKEKKGPPEEREVTVKKSSYSVHDAEEKDLQ